MRFAVLCSLLFAAATTFAADKPPKRLIEFGWDEPDTAFMRQHVTEMEQTPFDGCVFHLTGDSLWGVWGVKAYTDADLKPALDDLKATPFRRFMHNFLRVNTTPGKLDWFDDHSAVVNNVRQMARVAREGKCKGILFDIEQYDGPLFDYGKQRDAKTK